MWFIYCNLKCFTSALAFLFDPLIKAMYIFYLNNNVNNVMSFSGDVYSNNQSYEAPNNFEQQQHHLYDQQQQYENQQQQQQQQQQYEAQHELQQPDMQPDVSQQEQIHEGDSMSYDSPAHYDQPVTPLNLRGGRITRARLRSES